MSPAWRSATAPSSRVRTRGWRDTGPVRTGGVTAILPRPRGYIGTPVMAGCFSLNGNGELTGTIWVEESGQCEGPITLTNTHSCGVARDTTIGLAGGEARVRPGGSVIGIVATDAPLLPHLLKRLARRAGLGIGRSGSVSHHGSGNIFLALSTAARDAVEAQFLPNELFNPLFTAVVESIDEAVLDSMVANCPMTGRDGLVVGALPHDRPLALLDRYRPDRER